MMQAPRSFAPDVLHQRAMRALSLVSLAAPIVALAACTKPADPPSIQLTDVGYTLHLPAPMQQALDAAAPGFKSVNISSFRSDVAQASAQNALSSGALPAAFATIGDFNHDGSTDAVIEGNTPGDPALQVIAILNGAHPKAVPVTRFESYDADAVGIYLSAMPAGTPGAFEVVAYPDSTVAYQYADGAFKGTNTGK